MRESFYFDSNGLQLLGIYHPPVLSNERAHGVVLCYPFGQEYIRTHRLFKHLAERLSGDGYHVLRFDYAGTGDSAGQIADMRAGHWVENIADAIEELQESAGVQNVTLIGLRLGAALAILAAEKQPVHSLVLWDAIDDGSEYWRSLETQQQEWLLRHFIQPSTTGDVDEMLGFVISENFVDSVRQIALKNLATTLAQRALILCNTGSALPALENTLKRCGVHTDAQKVTGQPVWKDENLDKMLIPVKTLSAIQQWLNEVCG